MLLPRLWCRNWPEAALPTAAVESLQAKGVFLDTCLRQLAFGVEPRPASSPAPDPASDLALTELAGESLSGIAAYRFLLEVATGLRSAVPGETNVGGQFRRATDRAAQSVAPERWRELKPVVEALLADARALRRTHLQGIAGLSYGSLVRELLAPARDARILFVGAGDLARSMLPLFAASRVGIWSRRPSAPIANIDRWFVAPEADQALAWATNVVLTLPADPISHPLWTRRLRLHPQRSTVHLGLRHDAEFGAIGAHHHTLDDVFALAQSRSRRREGQLASAAAACAALASQRLPAPRQPARRAGFGDRLVATSA